MKILILHAHWGNRGDEAAIRAMIDSLRAEFPVEKMWIMIVGPRPDWFPYEDIEILEYYPRLWVWLNRPFDLFDFADAALSILTWGRFSLTNRGRRFLRVLGETDIVIHAPGGPSIGDLNGIGDLQYLYRLFAAKVLRGKPIFFYAPSMGPFSGRLKNILRKYILRKADSLVVREEISAAYLRTQLGLEAEVTLDSAFQNDICEVSLEGYEWSSLTPKTVGMVVTDLQWYVAYRDTPDLAARITNCALEVGRYLLNEGYSILLIPQLFGPAFATSELRLLETIRTLDTDRIHLLSPDMDAFGQQALISRLFCVISMRYHPVIFAAKGNTPFIAVYYEHKTKGFVEKAGLDEFSLDVRNLTADEVIRRFVLLEREYDSVRNRLRDVTPSLQAESRRTTELIVARLKGKES